MIGIVAAALVLIAVPATYVITRAVRSTHGAPDPTLRPGDEITQATLDSADPATFYWNLLDRLMRQPIMTTTSAYFEDTARFRRHDQYFANRVTIDHTGGKPLGKHNWTLANTSYYRGEPDSTDRCVDGADYSYSYDDPESDGWKREGADGCRMLDIKGAPMCDDIVANGLTAQQSDRVIDTLRKEYDGFVHPGPPQLITASGQRSIRQVVDFTPIQLADGSSYSKMLLIWAFKDSGLDPNAWQFSSRIADGPIHMVYYIDPATLLPTDSMQRTSDQQTTVYGYGFPDKLTPLNIKDSNPVRIAPPEGWRFPA